MIKVLNGGLVTSKATEEDIVPIEIESDGSYKLAGRNVFLFKLISGSFQYSVGKNITNAAADGFVQDTLSTAGDQSGATASPSLEDGGRGNIRFKGVATVRVWW